jgi:hypothetical protein
MYPFTNLEFDRDSVEVAQNHLFPTFDREAAPVGVSINLNPPEKHDS